MIERDTEPCYRFGLPGQQPSLHALDRHVSKRRLMIMLWTISLVLIVLWLLGMLTGYSTGGVIHILLVLSVISMALHLVTRRRLT